MFTTTPSSSSSSSSSSNTNATNFTIYHQYGQFPVEYNVDTWLDKCNKEFQAQRNALSLLQDSKKESISSAFASSAALSSAAATLNHSGANNAAFYLSSTNMDANNSGISTSTSSSLKRQASVRKMLTLSKRKTFTINFKLQIDSVFDSMRRTKCNFVFCMLPEQCKSDRGDTSSILSSSASNAHQVESLDVPMLRQQLKAYQILAACRIYRQGYPEFLNFDEFERRFAMFLGGESLSNQSLLSQSLLKNDDHKQACVNLIRAFDMDSAHYKLGNTQVFATFFFSLMFERFMQKSPRNVLKFLNVKI